MKTAFDTRPLRKTDVREKNEKLVLYLVREKGPISQSEVVQETGLKPPTIMRIFNNLHAQKLIQLDESVAAGHDRPGRKAVRYNVNPNAFYAVGIDFYARLVSVVVEGFSGNVVGKTVVDLPDNMQANAVLFEVKKAVWKTLSETGIQQDKIVGIGIGSPGVVDTSSGTVVFYSRIEGMQDFPIKNEIEETFGVPTIVHNNCSVIAQSEYRYGPFQGVGSLIVLLVRGGLGGAFVQNGRAFVNQTRTAFELGHMSVDFRSAPCGENGERGCLERWITESALLQAAHVSSHEELDEALVRRDERVLESLEEPCQALSEAVLTLSNILNPEAFVVVARSAALAEHLARKIELRHDRGRYTSRGLHIRFHGRVFDPLLACRGAIDLVMDRFFAAEIPVPRAPVQDTEVPT